MTRPWTEVEAEWVALMRERYGDLDAARSEEMARKLEEMRQAWEDPFTGLAENMHEGVKR